MIGCNNGYAEAPGYMDDFPAKKKVILYVDYVRSNRAQEPAKPKPEIQRNRNPELRIDQNG